MGGKSMHYMGGKSRTAKSLAAIIDQAEGDTLVSLFCGMCSVEKTVKTFDKVICCDKNPYLIAMWQDAQRGRQFPSTVTEDEFKWWRHHQDEDKGLAGFIGFACSWGGIGFYGSGYARDSEGTNYADRGVRTLSADIQKLKDATFLCKDYRDVDLPDGCVVYCDPPYKGVRGYNGETFDSDAFWDYMREISKTYKVYISELQAPDDFECIWQKDLQKWISKNKNNSYDVMTDKLFVYKSK